MRDHAVKPALCLSCGYTCDRASDTLGGRAKPKPGDFTLCLNCGALMRFTQDMGLVGAPEDVSDMLSPQQIRMIRRGQQFIRNRGPIRESKANG